jgi:hypothetical protein
MQTSLSPSVWGAFLGWQLELASDLLGAGVFGEDESAISALDRKYSVHKTPQRETQ